MSKKIFILFYLILLSVPLFTVIKNTPLFFSQYQNLSSFSYTLLKIFALYGITLLFIQIILGANMAFFMKTFGAKILNFHMLQGKIAYSIILSHPLLYFFYTFQTAGAQSLLPDFSKIRTFYLLLGETAFVLLTVAIFAAIFRAQPFLLKNWLKFHRINYIVFPIILVHSYLLGTDTKIVPFIFLYPIFIIVYLFTVLKKLRGPETKSF